MTITNTDYVSIDIILDYDSRDTSAFLYVISPIRLGLAKAETRSRLRRQQVFNGLAIAGDEPAARGVAPRDEQRRERPVQFIGMTRHNAVVAPIEPDTVFREKRCGRHGNNANPGIVGAFFELDFRQSPNEFAYGVCIGKGVPSKNLAVRLAKRGALDVCRTRPITNKETVKPRTIRDDVFVL